MPADRRKSLICEDPTHPVSDEEIARMENDPTYWADSEEVGVIPPRSRDEIRSRFVLSVALPMTLYDRLGRAAEAHGVPRSSYARAAIEAALEREAHPLVVRLDGEQAERVVEALRRAAG